MMIICESGSTKADWAIVQDDNQIIYTETVGINPLFHDGAFIYSELAKNASLATIKDAPVSIFYYGTSCSSPARNKIVQDGLASFFTKAHSIEVQHDLDGAVFAVATRGVPSMVSILGTGSNACFYDGQVITQQIGGNGFIISDEASGAYFGKVLIGDFLNELVPANMHRYMKEEMHLTRDILIDSIYRKPNANVYLAQFTKVLTLFKKETYVQTILRAGFQLFVRKHICRFPNYQQYPAHFIGSIAYHFQDILSQVCNEERVVVGNIIQKPMDGLVKFHIQPS